MGGKREEFFESLLNTRAAELLTSAQILVAKMDEERVTPSDGKIKGLSGNIYQTKPPKNFKDALGREDRQGWAKAYNAGNHVESLDLRPRPWFMIRDPPINTSAPHQMLHEHT